MRLCLWDMVVQITCYKNAIWGYIIGNFGTCTRTIIQTYFVRAKLWKWSVPTHVPMRGVPTKGMFMGILSPTFEPRKKNNTYDCWRQKKFLGPDIFCEMSVVSIVYEMWNAHTHRGRLTHICTSNKTPSFVQMMACRRLSVKALLEPMLA